MRLPWPPRKILDSTTQWMQSDAREATRQFWQTGMRWSYLASAVMVVIGLIVNLLLPHGWTVWPFVGAAGIMMMVHEAAERNGQGIPPLHVYALFFGAVAVWIIVMAILSVTNPLILILGVAGLGYYCAQAWLKQREQTKLFESRRAEGRCVHCGEIADAKLGVCMNCGNEPDPATIQLARVASIVHGSKRSERARAVIKGESLSAVATRKEKLLLAARSRNLPPKKK